MAVFIELPYVLLICAIIRETLGFDYCTIESCKKGDHTMCKYPTDKVACGDDAKVGLTDELRKVILDRHNVHRQTVALGKERRQPHASNMMMLTWHKEAEQIAQRWTNQCISGHDTCRNIESSTVGQNFAAVGGTGMSSDLKEVIVKLVDMWYNEVKDFNKEQVDSFQFVGGIAHYTQVVWAETTAIGCGFIQKPPENEAIWFYLFCNYVPSGNYMRSAVYKKGKACSQCPQETMCSMTYPGLCTKDKSDFGGKPEDSGAIAISLKPSWIFIYYLLLSVFGGVCHTALA